MQNFCQRKSSRVIGICKKTRNFFWKVFDFFKFIFRSIFISKIKRIFFCIRQSDDKFSPNDHI